MNIQVVGPEGMLGRAVVREAAAAGHTVVAERIGPIEETLPQHIKGEVVINCAGMVKQAQTSSYLMVAANSVGPHRLAAMCGVMRARLIHVSTDCVFRGTGPHHEEDLPDGIDLYARSKYTGEVVEGRHLTIRTSFVGFGPRGLINDLSHKTTVLASQKLLWSGHTVDTVAKLLIRLACRPDITGLLHIPGETQDRYELASKLKARWDLPAYLELDNDFVADRRLSSLRWASLELPPLPPFALQLLEMRGPQ